MANSQNTEAAFTELLKASIEDAERKSGEQIHPNFLPSWSIGGIFELKALLVEEEDGLTLASSTVQAVATDSISNLDMKSILGDVLYTLTSTMGIDMNAELSQSGDAKKDLQVLPRF